VLDGSLSLPRRNFAHPISGAKRATELNSLPPARSLAFTLSGNCSTVRVVGFRQSNKRNFHEIFDDVFSSTDGAGVERVRKAGDGCRRSGTSWPYWCPRVGRIDRINRCDRLHGPDRRHRRYRGHGRYRCHWWSRQVRKHCRNRSCPWPCQEVL